MTFKLESEYAIETRAILVALMAEVAIRRASSEENCFKPGEKQMQDQPSNPSSLLSAFCSSLLLKIVL